MLEKCHCYTYTQQGQQETFKQLQTNLTNFAGGKDLRKMVKQTILNHCQENNLISNYQHGFIRGSSCLTYLLATMEDLTSVYDSCKPFDIVCFELQKAIDSVPHLWLLIKLHSFRVQGNFNGWMEDFLSNRPQCIQVNGTK